ncbi:MAG: 2-dehydropantoate 2-reductase [Puniceicoccaceae bacterium 5H]|nr:MAG: 2-dehydropantoate 2-reductase [Puniceicoccaceae bacterium 5H]
MLGEHPKWAFVGVGAMGGYIAGRLAAGGEDMHLLLRSDYEAVRAQGMTVEIVPDEQVFRLTPDDVNPARDPAEIGPVDVVVVGLKSTANEALRTLLPPLLKPETVLVTLQNGLGNVELLSEIAQTNRVLGALCQIGANRVEPGLVRNFTPRGGFVQFGELPGAPEGLMQAVGERFQAAGIRVRYAASLGEALWRKLMWNVPFNGLTILSGMVPTIEIVEDPALRGVSLALMEELRLAAGRLGYAIEADYGPKQVEFTHKLGAYLPSTLLDYRAGRPVEVEAIWGEPLRLGQAAGQKMPHLAQLYAILRKLTKQGA